MAPAARAVRQTCQWLQNDFACILASLPAFSFSSVIGGKEKLPGLSSVANSCCRVADFPWNRWQLSRGMGGRFAVENEPGPARVQWFLGNKKGLSMEVAYDCMRRSETGTDKPLKWFIFCFQEGIF